MSFFSTKAELNGREKIKLDVQNKQQITFGKTRMLTHLYLYLTGQKVPEDAHGKRWSLLRRVLCSLKHA